MYVRGRYEHLDKSGEWEADDYWGREDPAQPSTNHQLQVHINCKPEARNHTPYARDCKP